MDTPPTAPANGSPAKDATGAADLASQSRWSVAGEGRYVGCFDESWYQGRAIFGGLVAAVIVRAMEAEVADAARRIRSLTLHLVAPARAVPGEVAVEILRRGGSVTQVAARLSQETGVVASALATFGADREHPIAYQAERMPALPPPESVPIAPYQTFMPVFAKHVEFRFCYGGVPMEGVAEPRIGGWCRFRESPKQADSALVAALLDIWPPPILVMRTEPSNSATIDITMHFLTPLPLAGADPDTLYAFTHESPTISNGYAEQFGSLWTQDGTLVGRVRQLLAAF